MFTMLEEVSIYAENSGMGFNSMSIIFLIC